MKFGRAPTTKQTQAGTVGSYARRRTSHRTAAVTAGRRTLVVCARMESSATTHPILAIQGLERRFGDRIVLSDFSLTAAAGDRVAIVGPNGVGKTTLLRCIAGTLTPTSGTVRVAGHDAGSLEARRSIGLSLSQERSFYLRLSGSENLLLFAQLPRPSRRPPAPGSTSSSTSSSSPRSPPSGATAARAAAAAARPRSGATRRAGAAAARRADPQPRHRCARASVGGARTATTHRVIFATHLRRPGATRRHTSRSIRDDA